MWSFAFIVVAVCPSGWYGYCGVIALEGGEKFTGKQHSGTAQEIGSHHHHHHHHHHYQLGLGLSAIADDAILDVQRQYQEREAD